MHNSALGNTHEFKASARQTRFALLVEGNVSPGIVGSGYIEGDFLGVGTGSNNNATNSYVPRLRHAYLNVDLAESGFHILAGQAWSLVGENSKGITPRNEVGMITIENQPTPGLVSARQVQLRLTKDFDKKLWLSVSAEESATTFGSGCGAIVSNTGAAVAPTTVVNGQTVTCQAGGVNGYAQGGETTPYSLNQAPDIIGKIAYEARVADRDVHLETFGLYRNYLDRVNYTNGTNVSQSTNSFAIGGGIVATIIPQRLDMIATGLIGKGIGRYGASGLGDATLAANGAVAPLRGADFFGGFVFHATDKIDLYSYGGFEKLYAKYSATAPGVYVGYGAPNAVDTGCYIEGSTACAGNTHLVWQVNGGIWDKIYQGPFGYVRAGLQYTYVKRDLFASTAGPGGSRITPSGDDHIFYTSLRYYPF
jgi:hypothetical protein